MLDRLHRLLAGRAPEAPPAPHSFEERQLAAAARYSRAGAAVTYEALCQGQEGVLPAELMRPARWSTPDAADCDDQEPTGCL